MNKLKHIKKITIAAVAFLVIASGCSANNNDDNNESANNAGNNNQVSEQPQDPSNNDANTNDGADEEDAANEGNSSEDHQDGSTDQDGNEDTNSGEDSSNDKDDAPIGEVTPAAIAEKIQAEVQMGTLWELEEDQIKDTYGIDPSEHVEDGVFLPAMMNISSFELTIVKLKSDEHFDAIHEAMEQRAASIQKTFESYLPDQYEASKNYQIVRQGDYVLFSISFDQDKIAEIFRSFLAE